MTGETLAGHDLNLADPAGKRRRDKIMRLPRGARRARATGWGRGPMPSGAGARAFQAALEGQIHGTGKRLVYADRETGDWKYQTGWDFNDVIRVDSLGEDAIRRTVSAVFEYSSRDPARRTTA